MVYTKKEAKIEIKKKVEEYLKLKSEGKIRANDEEQIKQHFIEPLFEYLGWDMRNPEEVIKEEKVGRKKVDFAFKINEVTRFFVEAKAYNIDLLDKAVVEQALNYGWNKGITWTILTNFERIFILNSEWKITGNLLMSRYKTLYFDRLVDEQFEDLWLLSKESFLENKLDEKAEKEEKKAKRMPVTSQLFQDLTTIRDKLRSDIIKNNKSLVDKQAVVDEIIQRIIDKLIFIRKTEDLGIEDYPLKSALHLYKSSQLKQLCKKIQEIFLEFDSKYNSELFKEEHISNKVVISDEKIYEVAKILYSPDERFAYNFAQIEADVLGNIYEQYLSLLLKGGDIRGKFQISKLHKKEQGIYYTPTYVVDYIVKNTIGVWSKSKKNNIYNVRIVDISCGSGSFLIRALDFIYKELIKNDGEEYQSQLDDGRKARTSLKSDIVKNNIFGVDLDEKSIDIAQLNLLLKTAETRQKLPMLKNNIKMGDSLIDDKHLESKAFNWYEEFSLMDSGGFDIVIGNPPYVNMQTMPREQEYFKHKYPQIYTGQNDYLYYFVLRGLSLLKNYGYLGFIISRYFLESAYANRFRNHILDTTKVIRFIDFGNIQLFGREVNVLTSIITLQKDKDKKARDSNKVQIIKVKKWNNSYHLLLSYIEDKQTKKEYSDEYIDVFYTQQSDMYDKLWNFSVKHIDKIKEKITKDSTPLSSFCYVGKGMETGFNKAFILSKQETDNNKIEKELLRNYVKTRDIRKYITKSRNMKIIYIPNKLDITEYPNTIKYLNKFQSDLKKRYDYKKKHCEWYGWGNLRNRELFEKETEKIITPLYSTSNKFIYDKGGKESYYTLTDTYVIFPKESIESNLKYILAIINSKLVEFFHKNTSKLKREGYYEYSGKSLERIPIKLDESKKNIITNMVDEIIEISNRLSEQSETSERDVLMQKYQKLLDKLDQEVYKLYGITDKEIEIIEKSLV